MATPGKLRRLLRFVEIFFVLYVAIVAIVYFRQRSMLYFPSHGAVVTRLAPWSDGSQTIGFCREVSNPRTIWLMMHGNGGQAADRDYVLHCLTDQDSLYVLEYPGYGARSGSPSLESMNQAASEACQLLRSRYPNIPVCALGESIGTGPACHLALEKTPPDKIVLAVPFDILARVAARQFPFLPVRLLLRDNWDNVDSLKHYAGPVDIFGAMDDGIIPIDHARALAKQVSQARLITVPGGHNEWSNADKARIRR